jgi:hypothetical protein
MMASFLIENQIDAKLTGKDHKRLISAEEQNFNFIGKAFDIARGNPSIMPHYLEVTLLEEKMRDLEDLRELMQTLQQFSKLAGDAYMFKTDVCYRDAQYIYSSLQFNARRELPGAQKLFSALNVFFNRTRRKSSEGG